MLAVSSTTGHGRSLPSLVVMTSTTWRSGAYAFITYVTWFRKPCGTR